MATGELTIRRNYPVLTSEEYIVVPVLNYHTATVQVNLVSGTWSSGVVQVYKANLTEHPAGFSPAVTFTDDGLSSTIDVTGVAYLIIHPSTSSGGSARVDIGVCAKDGTTVISA